MENSFRNPLNHKKARLRRLTYLRTFSFFNLYSIYNSFLSDTFFQPLFSKSLTSGVVCFFNFGTSLNLYILDSIKFVINKSLGVFDSHSSYVFEIFRNLREERNCFGFATAQKFVSLASNINVLVLFFIALTKFNVQFQVHTVWSPLVSTFIHKHVGKRAIVNNHDNGVGSGKLVSFSSGARNMILESVLNPWCMKRTTIFNKFYILLKIVVNLSSFCVFSLLYVLLKTKISDANF